MNRVETTVTIVNKLGLHARAATKLAQLSTQFEAKTELVMNEKKADTNSIMALMLLAGGQGKQVTIVSEGDDASEAVEAIAALINDRFEEAE